MSAATYRYVLWARNLNLESGMSKKDIIKRLEESLARFPPDSDMHAEIARQLHILKHPVCGF